MSSHGANDNDLQLSFGIQPFHIAHLHSPLFQPLSVNNSFTYHYEAGGLGDT
jgi:hypothetical protein